VVGNSVHPFTKFPDTHFALRVVADSAASNRVIDDVATVVVNAINSMNRIFVRGNTAVVAVRQAQRHDLLLR